MGNFVLLSCGNTVLKLVTPHSKSCVALSPLKYDSYINSDIDVKKSLNVHYLYKFITHHFSPIIFQLSYLLNTFFTRFPQHLLLLQRNKLSERYQ